MRLARSLLLLALPLAVPLAAAAGARAPAVPPADAVLVVGALHALHEREPAFDFARLRSAIVAFAPDVMVLEVRPDELAGRKATPGRPEYPAVIWPLLAQTDTTAVAMEPGGDSFTAISGAASAAFAALRERDPAGAAALARLDAAAEDILLAYWQSAAQVQDETTATLAAGQQAAQIALAGPSFAAAQARWDAHMAAQALVAIRDHPGKRVMVIGSYRNRALLEGAVRDAVPTRALSAAAWFASIPPAAAPTRGVDRR